MFSPKKTLTKYEIEKGKKKKTQPQSLSTYKHHYYKDSRITDEASARRSIAYQPLQTANHIDEVI